MTIRTARPYAAKAIIEHEFDTDHLNIWITFRFPMDQTTKPANNLWLCEVDDVAKVVNASAWQDEFTMLLTVNAIASIPTRVTVEYDGPDVTLKTTWEKQWEPWGPILSSDGSLLPYGNFYGFEINWTQAAAIDTWYDISDADIVSNVANKMTFQNNQEYKIAVSGFYLIMWFLTVEISIAGKHVLAGVAKNGARQNPGITHHHFGRANEEHSMSGSLILNLVVDDLITIGVETSDAGNPTLTVDHLGVTVVEIGIT